MNHSTVFLISCLLLGSNAWAAFRDFVVESEAEQQLQLEPNNDIALGCPAEEEQPLISFHDVEQDGIVDTQLLLAALMQHAQRLGMNLEQLAQMQAIGEEDVLDSDAGCSAAESLSYRDQPSWYDVFFN
ncbi:uncharacterized protein [Drosophila virilis]|uniref:EF-hand domain-containing protein n=1 Tax=Drosophila virilis TaxID=7244 RepID=B4LQ99_DROVI|nr:uncharacterized protein LOC6624797 [Drosophila virilis]EDW61384.1 uncharacterized protein Dvir_GJ20333 [Drosophila virilis]